MVGSAYRTRPPSSTPNPVSASPQSCRSPNSTDGVTLWPSGHVTGREPSRTTRSRWASASVEARVPAAGGHLVRGHTHEHGVRPGGQLKAPGLRGRQHQAPAPEGPHHQSRVRLQGPAGALLQGQRAPPVAQHAPHGQPVGDRIAQVGMETRQGVLQLAAAFGLSAGKRAVAPAVGDRHPGQPALPFAIHAQGAREDVPVQGQGPVPAGEPRAGHPAPGRQAPGAGGSVRAQSQPEGTAHQ